MMNENRHNAATRTSEITIGAGIPAMGKFAGSIIVINKNLNVIWCGQAGKLREEPFCKRNCSLYKECPTPVEILAAITGHPFLFSSPAPVGATGGRPNAGARHAPLQE
jgi:hypothetical protein